MKTGDRIFIFGKAPTTEGMMESLFHPADKKLKVRFVKHPETGKLYFNFKDFLKPYKNSKYEKIILGIVHKKMKKLDQIWMSCEAWEEIKSGIDEGSEKDIVTGWKERLLF